MKDMDDNRFNGKSLGVIEKEADELSLQNQKEYVACLRLLAIIGTAMVGALLLYDDFGMSRLIFVYAALMIAGTVIIRISNKNKYHENYINYRLLAEVARVQSVLDGAGIMKTAAEYFSYTMKDDTAWIRELIANADHSCEKMTSDMLKERWLKEQYNYHMDAEKKVSKQLRLNDRISGIVKIAVIVIVVVACVLECIPDIDMTSMLGHITIKGSVLIAVGLLSTISFFLSSYYGKLNLERKRSDHIEMAKLYKEVLDNTKDSPLTEKIIEKTAREEILENGNWYSYMKENRLTLDF